MKLMPEHETNARIGILEEVPLCTILGYASSNFKFRAIAKKSWDFWEEPGI